MSQDTLVNVEHLTRRYGALVAVSGISFRLLRGEVLGFLGPNGAGKSTTMQVITGNLAPSEGRVTINGIDLLDDPREAKREIGFLPEQPPLYLDFTVDEYLTFCARLNRITRGHVTTAVERAKERCGLGGMGRRLIGNLSKGYRQRVGIAQAIIHSPAVVVLDEPTVGLDPIQILEIRALIRELGSDHGVILSTHILPEVQMTCNQVQIINRGRLVFDAAMEDIVHKLAPSSLILGARRLPGDTELLSLPGVETVERLGDDRVRIGHAPDASPAETLAETAVREGWGLFELAPERKTLEQIFVEVTAAEEAGGEEDAAAPAEEAA